MVTAADDAPPPTAAKPNELRRVAVSVCDGCREGRQGECHMPGCIFWFHSIDEVPELTYRHTVLDGPLSDMRTLPDALLDDDTISPLAKMAYWYLKRHGGEVMLIAMSEALNARPCPLTAELEHAGWVFTPRMTSTTASVQFTVHEVPAVGR